MPDPDSQAHYDTLLGPIYSWMAGGPDAVEAAGRALVADLGLTTPVPGSEPPLVVDLGCGPGGVALALADAGYEVLAIDNCRSLLNDSVVVHDLLHERAADGAWGLRTSTYRKLRLAPSLVEAWVREAGLTALHRSDLRGMVRLVGRR